MQKYENLLNTFTQQSKRILGDALVGVYLHGSAAMGCFHEQTGDLDLLIVISGDISDEIKRCYMDMIVELNRQAPAKGLELSVVKKEVCSPFVYPTPFELHFSASHLNWYQTDPEGYISKMKGTDKDLAAHSMILYHRGKTLYGQAIREVFSEPDKVAYSDSIRLDVENAEEEILDNPTYMILNLCRVLAYQKDCLILSKQEGGEWGLKNVSPKYAGLISNALTQYRTGNAGKYDPPLLKEYAGHMLGQIK